MTTAANDNNSKNNNDDNNAMQTVGKPSEKHKITYKVIKISVSSVTSDTRQIIQFRFEIKKIKLISLMWWIAKAMLRNYYQFWGFVETQFNIKFTFCLEWIRFRIFQWKKKEKKITVDREIFFFEKKLRSIECEWIRKTVILFLAFMWWAFFQIWLVFLCVFVSQPKCSYSLTHKPNWTRKPKTNEIRWRMARYLQWDELSLGRLISVFPIQRKWPHTR